MSTSPTKLHSHEPLSPVPQSSAQSLQPRALPQRLLGALADSSPQFTFSKTSHFSRTVVILAEFLQFWNLLGLLEWAALPKEYNLLVSSFKYSRLDLTLEFLGGKLASDIILGLTVLLPLVVLAVAVGKKRPIKAKILRNVVGKGSWLASEPLLLPLSLCFLSEFKQISSFPWGFLYFPSLFLIFLHRNCLYSPQWRYPTLYAHLECFTGNMDLLANQLLAASSLLYEGNNWDIAAFRIFLGLYMAALYLVRKPYYCAETNTLLSAKYLLFAYVAALLQLNSTLSLPNFLPLFSIFGSLALFLGFLCSHSHISAYLTLLFPALSVPLTLQKQLIALCSLSNRKEIEDFFEQLKGKFGSTLEVGVWEGLYYAATRELEKGRVRLGLWMEESSGWQVHFIRWKLIRTFQNAQVKAQLRSDDFSCYQDSSEAINQDISACLSFLHFLAAYHSDASSADLFSHAQLLCTAVAKAKQGYIRLNSMHPNNTNTSSLQNSFIWTVKGDVKLVETYNSMRFKGDNCPFMVINASKDWHGRIDFMNQSCCELLQRTISEDEDLYLSSLLPACFPAFSHNKTLRNHIKTAETGEFVHNRVFFLTKAPIGLQVRISAWIVCTAKDVLYEAKISPLASQLEEFALISLPDSRIEVRSSAFCSVLGLTSTLDRESGVEDRVKEAVERARGNGREIRLTCERYELGQFRGVLLTVCTYEKEATSFFPASLNKSAVCSLSTSLPCSSALKRAKIRYKQQTSLLWILQFCFSILLVVVLGIILSFYFDVFAALDSVSVVNDMGRRRFRTANIVDCARELQLIGAGLLPQLNATQVQLRLVQEVADLKGIVSGIRNLSMDWPPGALRDMYCTPTVPIWEQHNDSLALSKVPLFDAMSKIVSAGSALSLSPSANFTSPDAFYLFRNGLGETMNYLNISTFSYVEMELEFSWFIIERLTMATLLVSIVLIVMSFAMGMCLVAKLEQVNLQVWALFYSSSPSALIQKYKLLADRVRELSGLEGADALGGVMRHRKGRGKRLGGWVVLLLAIHAAGSMAFVISLTMQMETYVNINLSSKIPYMNWAGMRRWLSAYNYVWLRELYLTYSSLYSYYQLNPAKQLIPNAGIFARNLTNLYHLTEKTLIYGSTMSLIKDASISPRHFDLLFSSPCAQLPAVTNCTSSFLSKGLHYAQQAYILELRTLQDLMISKQPVSWTDVQAVTKRGKTVGQGFAQAAIVYDEDGTEAVRRTMRELVLYIVAYLAAGLLYSGVVVLWGVRRYRGRLEVVRRVCKWMQIS